jgi:SNW domain-containing protein 1
MPINPEDFGDGGAFPEIHIVQYPLDMGRPGVKSTAVIAVNVDEKGQVSYDAIVKQGGNANKIVQTSLDDIKEKKSDASKIVLPDEKEELETSEKTKAALESLLESKIRSSKPSSVVHPGEAPEPTYILYTPNPSTSIASKYVYPVMSCFHALIHCFISSLPLFKFFNILSPGLLVQPQNSVSFAW